MADRSIPPAPRDGLYVTWRLLRPLTTGLRRLGLDVRTIVDESGLRPEVQTSPNDCVDYRVAFRIAEFAQQSYGETLPFDLAALYQPGLFGAVDFLGQTSRTLGDAISLLRTYEQTNQNVTTMAFETQGELVRITQNFHCPERPPRPVSEGTLAFLVAIARMLTGEHLPLTEVRLAHSRPCDPRPHRDFFGLEPTWHAPHDGIAFEAWILEVPMLRADPALSNLLEGHVRALAAIYDGSCSLTQRVRHCIGELLPSRRVTAVDVSAALDISVRSMQRGLAFEGTSFATLSKDVRCEVAVRLLKDPSIPFERIVEAAGFRDRSAFNRAFKQWTGTTPSHFRKRASA